MHAAPSECRKWAVLTRQMKRLRLHSRPGPPIGLFGGLPIHDDLGGAGAELLLPLVGTGRGNQPRPPAMPGPGSECWSLAPKRSKWRTPAHPLKRAAPRTGASIGLVAWRRLAIAASTVRRLSFAGTENVSGKVHPRAQDLQGLDGLRDLTVVGWTSQPNWRSTWRVWAEATETPVTVQLCVWGREDEVIEVLEAPSHRPR